MSQPTIDSTVSKLKAKLDADYAADLAALQRLLDRGLLASLIPQSNTVNGVHKPQIDPPVVPDQPIDTHSRSNGEGAATISPMRHVGRRTSSILTERAVEDLVKGIAGNYTVADINQRLHDQERPTPRTSVREALDELVNRGLVAVVLQGKAGRATVYKNVPLSEPQDAFTPPGMIPV